MAVTYDKEGGYLSITEDGVTYRRGIRVEDGVVSVVDSNGSKKVDLLYTNVAGQLVLVLEDESVITVTAGGGDMTKAVYDTQNEGAIRLTPRVSSSGPEGTISYSSADDHVYVGTEV